MVNLGKRLEYVKMGENARLGNKNKLSKSSVIRKVVR